MTAPTQPVTIRLADFGGEASQGVIITARPDLIDRTADGVFVSTEPVTGVTDENGEVVLELFPNAVIPAGLGTTGSTLRVTAQMANSRPLDVLARIPDSPCNLVDVLVDEQPIPLSTADLAVSQAQAYASQAGAARDTAVTAAGTATTQAGIATTKAGEAVVSAAAAAASRAAIDNRLYPGTYAVAPTTRPPEGTGAAIQNGDRYVNSADGYEYIRVGGVWTNAPSSAQASAVSAAQAANYAAAAATGSKFYNTIALGNAGVADAATFGVIAGGSDGLLRPSIYRRESAGVSTLLYAVLPASEYDALFPGRSPSGYVFALLDAYGKAAWGVLPDGTVRAAYLSADTMTAVSLLVGTDNITSRAPYGYAHALIDATGKALYAAKSGSAMEIPDLAAVRINGVPAGLVVRRKRTVGSGNYPADICHVLSYGQSLSIGALCGFPQTLTQPSNALMFNAGVRAYEGGGTTATNRGSLVALVENYNSSNQNGETPCGQFAAMAMRLIDEENGLSTADHAFQLLLSACGIANTTIAALRVVAGQNFENDVNYGLQRAQALGKTYNVPAVIWTHGTSDITTSTSQASYYADFNTLYANINTLVKGYTGQTNNVKLICVQPFVSSAANPTYDSTNVGLAFLQAAHNNPDIIIACPEYAYDHQVANVHLASTGSGALGGKYGEVFKRVIVDGETWTALGDDAQITATRQGVLLTLTFNNVQRGPLVLDTTGGAIANSGFIVRTAGGTPRTINSVAIAGANQVKLNVTGLSATDTVEYGFTTFGGNLRDSEGVDLVLEQRAKRALHNWCIGFKKTIT